MQINKKAVAPTQTEEFCHIVEISLVVPKEIYRAPEKHQQIIDELILIQKIIMTIDGINREAKTAPSVKFDRN